MSDNVLHEQDRLNRKGEETSQKPASKIEDWLELLERTHTSHRDDPRVLERIKKSYHKQYLIRESDVPESVFLLEQKIARNQGHGEIEITDEFRREKTKQIISDQEHSLDKWIDYLTSPDAQYPMWTKYWAFTSMVTMGKFEKSETEDGKEIASFKKRDSTTVAPFPPMNARALAMAISVIEAKAKENAKQKKDRQPLENVSTKLNPYEFKELVELENFSKLYTQFLIELPEYSTEGLRETRGKWVKYERGSEPDALVASLDGHPLEWCTANIDTARTQLEGGDFYVYYSFDSNSNPTIPRVAIRMEEGRIAEVRGIAVDQNLDPYISDVVKEKMIQFPDGEQYNKKSSDMKRVTEIEDKHKQGEELSKEDLRFLYQIDGKIEGFGYYEDPRILEILSKRNHGDDVQTLSGCKREGVANDFYHINQNTEVFYRFRGTVMELFDYRLEVNKTKLKFLFEVLQKIKDSGSSARVCMNFGGILDCEKEQRNSEAVNDLEYIGNISRSEVSEEEWKVLEEEWDKSESEEWQEYERDRSSAGIKDIEYPEAEQFEVIILSYDLDREAQSSSDKIIEDAERLGLRPLTPGEVNTLECNYPSLSEESDSFMSSYISLIRTTNENNPTVPFLVGNDRRQNNDGITWKTEWGKDDKFLFTRK
jgi:hypothetical protein